MRVMGAVILAITIFLFVFLVFAVGVNALVARKASTFGVYLSILPAPFAALCALRIAFKILKTRKKSATIAIIIPIAIIAALGGALFPELERAVLNAAADGRVIMGFTTSCLLVFFSWLLSSAVFLFMIRKHTIQIVK